MTPRLAVVTGAAGGIGNAVVVHLRRLGWRVIACDRDALPRAAAASDSSSDDFVRSDIGTGGGRAELIDHVLSSHDRLDALVNNAAVPSDKPLLETADPDWAETFEVNVMAPFVLMRELYPLLKAAQGSVVNVASVHAVATSPNAAAYAASKAALVGLTRAAALEFGADGVRVNAVLPGAVDTDMLRAGLLRSDHPDGAEGARRNLVDRTPIGFIAAPDQVAPTIAFLLDPERSGYVTGHALAVDGGALSRLGTE
jgi:glucose 1-dehydrogenase